MHTLDFRVDNNTTNEYPPAVYSVSCRLHVVTLLQAKLSSRTPFAPNPTRVWWNKIYYQYYFMMLPHSDMNSSTSPASNEAQLYSSSPSQRVIHSHSVAAVPLACCSATPPHSCSGRAPPTACLASRQRCCCRTLLEKWKPRCCRCLLLEKGWPCLILCSLLSLPQQINVMVSQDAATLA